MKGKHVWLLIAMVLLIACFAWPAFTRYYDNYSTNVLVKGYLDCSTPNAISAECSRSESVALASLTTNGAPVAADGTTNPGIATTDYMPALVWANGENTPAEYTFPKPADYSGGFRFKAVFSTSDDTTPPEVDWEAFVNQDDAVFASTIAEAAVSLSACSSTNQEATFNPDSTLTSALASGNWWLTLHIWPTDTGSGTTEMKGFRLEYTGTR